MTSHGRCPRTARRGSFCRFAGSLRCCGCICALFTLGFQLFVSLHFSREPDLALDPGHAKLQHRVAMLFNSQQRKPVDERHEEEGLISIQNYYDTNFTDQTEEMAQLALELTFEKDDFLGNLQRWRRRVSTATEMHRTVTVMVTYPQLSARVPPTYEPLLQTVRDAVSSPQAEVVVYLAHHQLQAAFDLRQSFREELATGQLQILGETTNDNLQRRIGARYPHLYNNLNFAYLLELAYQSGSDYTLMLRAGSHLVVAAPTNNTASTRHNYAMQAIEHYEDIARDRALRGDYNQTSWMWLSDKPPSFSPPTHLFLETSLHAHRLANVLRLSLPYNRLGSMSILDRYRVGLLWQAPRELGPHLFDYTKPFDQVFASDSSGNGSPFVNASELIALPPWINSTNPKIMGPVLYAEPRDYYIAFGVNTLARPKVGASYLQAFLKDLLHMVQNVIAEFTIPVHHQPQKRNAIIVLLVCGDTLADISSHRAFLETTYAKEINEGWMELVDAPLVAYNATLIHRRNTTFVGDPPERVYWRTKQNLDVAATLTAVADQKSEFVMLLEDDTGFQQPNFTTSLNATLYQALANDQGVPAWSRVEYGFGYSGILLHYSDLHVYEQIHLTFADEMPCDLLSIYKLVKTKINRMVRNRRKFPDNNRTHFLTHKGQYSTLLGKEQPVW